MTTGRTVWLLALLLLPASASAADAPPPGRALYLRYCSACHGESGRGDGVVSSLMRPAPADLTQLAARAGGKFQFAEVAAKIDGRETVRAHGDPNMPVWGDLLVSESGGTASGETAAQTKLAQITRYLETIQTK